MEDADERAKGGPLTCKLCCNLMKIPAGRIKEVIFPAIPPVKFMSMLNAMPLDNPVACRASTMAVIMVSREKVTSKCWDSGSVSEGRRSTIFTRLQHTRAVRYTQRKERRHENNTQQASVIKYPTYLYLMTTNIVGR